MENITQCTQPEPKSFITGTVVALILLVEFIIGAFGNSLVILAVIIFNEVRTTANVFLVNLAVTDLLVSLLCLLWSITTFLDVSNTFHVVSSAAYCFVAAITLLVCLGCSALTLASIAFQRCILITRPSQMHGKIFQKKILCIWIALLWSLPVLLVIPHSSYLWHGMQYRQFASCRELHQANFQRYIKVVIVMCFCLLPLLVIILCYVNIYTFIRNHRLKMKDSGFVSATTAGSSESDNQSGGQSQRITSKETRFELATAGSSGSGNLTLTRLQTRGIHGTLNRRLGDRELQITKNMFYIIVAFVICFMPYLICLIILDNSDIILKWTQLLVLVNCCVNPLIYATKHPKFKMLFRKILGCKCKGISGS